MSEHFNLLRLRATRNGATAVYAYLRLDGRPYYVGVSTGPLRVIDQRGHRKHGISVPKDKSRIVFLRGPLTKAAAAAWEMFYISKFGRKDLGSGYLLNRSSGGEGLQDPSPETRRKISAAGKGRPPSPLAVAHIRTFGMLPKSEEHKKKISLAQKGRKLSPEHAANVAASKALAVAQRAASLGLTVEQYKQQIAAKAIEGKRRHKRQLQETANALGMSVRSYSQWLADGQPSDHAPYRKAGVPPIPGHEDLANQAKRRAERNLVGLSERQYRLWVKDGRPTNVDHYRTIYGKPGRRSKSALQLNAA